MMNKYGDISVDTKVDEKTFTSERKLSECCISHLEENLDSKKNRESLICKECKNKIYHDSVLRELL